MSQNPSVIGRYQVLSRIGQGGMGVLFLAWDPKLERQIALKVLRDDSDELRERFARESRAIAKLRHPNIVTVFDVGEQDGQPFIAMEYIVGRTLADIIKNNDPIDVVEKLKFVTALCDGLHFAHKAGIVHRDIKPANVMVEHDGAAVKILDFGIARIAESGMTQAGILIGTLNYMSPEQVAGTVVDRRSDIFAVGTLLYELLVYRQAFPGGLQHGLLNRLLHEPPPPLDSIEPAMDREVIEIVARALRKDPDERYQDLSLMRKDLQRVLLRLDSSPHAPTVVSGPGKAVESGVREGGTTSDQHTAASPPRAARLGLAARAVQLAAHLEDARRALDAQRFEDAIDAAERALLLDPDEGHAIDLRDQARTARDEAIERAREERERARVQAEALAAAMSRAHAAFEAGRFEDAETATEEALLLSPDHAKARALRGEVRQAIVSREAVLAREREEARRLREREMAIAAAIESARAAAGHEEAIAILTEAQQLDPERQDVRDALSTRQAALEREREEARQAQERQKRAAIAAALATAQRTDGHEQAIAILREAQALDPHDAGLRDAIETRQAALDRAREEARRAQEERDKRAAAIAAALAKAQATTGHEQAIAILTSAQSLDPQHGGLREALDARRMAWDREREAARQAQEREARVAEALAAAQAVPSHEAALAILTEARHLDMQHGGLAQAIAQRQAALDRERDEARRARERVEAIAAALAGARRAASHEDAIAILQGGLAADPSHPEMRQLLQERSEALEHDRARAREELERRAAIAAAVREAKAERSPAAALVILARARALDPQGFEVQALIEAREANLERERAAAKRQQAEAQRAQAIAAARTMIVGLLEKDDLAAAETALHNAEATLQATSQLKDVRRQLTRRRKAATRDGAAPRLQPATMIGVAAAVVLLAGAGYWMTRPADPAVTNAIATGTVPAPVPLPAPPPTPAPIEPSPAPAPAPAPGQSPSLPAPTPVPSPPVREPDPGTDPRVVTVAIQQGRQQIGDGRLAQAAATLEAAIKAAPSNGDLKAFGGELMDAARRPAANARAAAMNRGPLAIGTTEFRDGQARLAEGDTHAQAGRYARAVQAFAAAASLFAAAERSAVEAQARLEAAKQPPPREVAPPIPSPVPSTAGNTNPPPEPRVPPAPVPQPTPVPPAPVQPTVSDEDSIRATLRAYEAAYGSLSADAVKAVYPGADAGALRKNFDNFREWQLTVNCPQIVVTGPTARATCQVRNSFLPKVGGRRSPEARFVFQFQKTGNRWVISRFDGA